MTTPQISPKPCGIPPMGWRCARPAGHDGPCAAIPLTMEEATFPHRNALAVKELCEVVKEIAGSMHGQVLPTNQVVSLCHLNLPNVGRYIEQLETQIGTLEATIANARGWIMANTCVPAHDILKTLNTHLEDQPE